MDFEYQTERLILKVLDASYASDTLRFFSENQNVFEKYEALRAANFYTLNYQRSLLSCEYKLFFNRDLVRFWLFLKEDPSTIIGTVSYQHFRKDPYQSCQIGYRLHKDYWHQGYATEALHFCCQLMFSDLPLHRIEAYVMPDNVPSIRLLESTGFTLEGFCRSMIKICGTWRDHYLYALIKEDFLTMPKS